MRRGEPLPKAWWYVTVIAAVLVAAALTGHSTSFRALALAAVLAVGFAARLLYSRTRK